MMRIGIPHLAFLLVLVSLSMGVEWYEQGHLSPLTRDNFDSLIHEPSRYKFVKFYTRSCRYCRMLKQVEQQLREEKQWGFRFYDVDCTVHYDFCQTKAAISAFPYVGVYNLKGELEGHIGGYYPIDTMRQAFEIIERKQNDAIAAGKSGQAVRKTEKVAAPDATLPATKTSTTPSVPSVKANPNPSPEKPKQTSQNSKTHESSPQKPTNKATNDGWSSEISDGIKICIVLFGIWMYGKTINPYLQPQQTYPKSRILQIPIGRNKQPSLHAKPDEKSPLMNDVI